jgi:hypothetical protein
VSEYNDYLWLVNTNKGDFFVEAVGRWNLEEAAKKIWWVFEQINVDITGMIPRKRITGPDDMRATLFQQTESEIKNPLGFYFMAGKKLWSACGRGAEYDAEKVLLGKQLGGI